MTLANPRPARDRRRPAPRLRRGRRRRRPAARSPGRGLRTAGRRARATDVRAAHGRGRACTSGCSSAVPALLGAPPNASTPRPLARVLLTAAATWAVLGGRSLRARGRRPRRPARRTATWPPPGCRSPTWSGATRAALDADELARACVESVAENTSDAVVAPLLWGAVAGVPGPARLPRREHPRRDGRAPLGALPAASGGPPPASTTCSTSARPASPACSPPSPRPWSAARPPPRWPGGPPRRRPAPQPERRGGRGRLRRCARRPARRGQRLRRATSRTAAPSATAGPSWSPTCDARRAALPGDVAAEPRASRSV